MLVLGAISKTFISIGIWIVTGIYTVAAAAFRIFLILADGELISSSSYDLMIKNMYIVIGIVMLFILAFGILRSMVNPDDQKKGTETVKKIIINLIVSGVSIVLLPSVFSFLFDFQSSIINNNVIGRFFNYGSSGNMEASSEDARERVKEGAYRIANGVYTAFFNVADCSENSEECPDVKSTEYAKLPDGTATNSLKDVIADVEKDGKFSYYTIFSESVDNGEIDFNFILSLIAGCLLTYVGISFCFDMAVRLVKLIFYQVIAPFPIFLSIIPDTKVSDMYSKWIKVTLTCYLEVFVRILSLYFAIYLCDTLLSSGGFFSSEAITSQGWFIRGLAKAFVLMGIITFMRQFPKLLSEVTGIDSGNMKLGIRDKLKDGGFFAAGALAGGALTAATRNAVNAGKNTVNKFKDIKGKTGKDRTRAIGSAVGSTFSGLGSVIAGGVSGGVRSGKSGFKAGSVSDMKNSASSGASAAVKAREKRDAYKAKHGGHTIGVISGHFEDAWDSGMRWAGINNIETYQREISSMENVNSKVDAVADEARKVLASNAKTGKTFTYGLSGIVDNDVARQYGVTMEYSLDNYRNLENALQRAQSSGEAVDFMGKKFEVDELSRLQNLYVTNYAESVANQAFKSAKNYEAIVANMSDYKEQAAMSSIRAKAEDARNEMSRVLNSEAVKRANDAAQKYAAARGKTAELLNASTIEGDLHITNRSALNYYGSATKEVKSEYLTEISKIQQKEKDKKGE